MLNTDPLCCQDRLSYTLKEVGLGDEIRCLSLEEVLQKEELRAQPDDDEAALPQITSPGATARSMSPVIVSDTAALRSPSYEDKTFHPKYYTRERFGEQQRVALSAMRAAAAARSWTSYSVDLDFFVVLVDTVPFV